MLSPPCTQQTTRVGHRGPVKPGCVWCEECSYVVPKAAPLCLVSRLPLVSPHVPRPAGGGFISVFDRVTPLAAGRVRPGSAPPTPPLGPRAGPAGA